MAARFPSWSHTLPVWSRTLFSCRAMTCSPRAVIAYSFNITLSIPCPWCADLVVSLLALHVSYRAWRLPDEAVSLQSGIPFLELHSHLPDAGGQNPSAVMASHGSNSPQPLINVCVYAWHRDAATNESAYQHANCACRWHHMQSRARNRAHGSFE